MNKTKLSNRKMVIAAMLGAITVVLGMTPLGFIPLGILNATTLHIPVIVGAIAEGPIVGALVGLIFGMSSFVRAFTNPTPISPILYNPLISVLPRILIGITTYYTYKILKDKDKDFLKNFSYVSWILIILFLIFMIFRNINKSLSALNLVLMIVLLLMSIGMLIYTRKGINENASVVSAAFVGSMTNSILVMGGIYLLYANKYAIALNLNPATVGSAVLGVIVAQSLPEAIISCIITSTVIGSLKMRKM